MFGVTIVATNSVPDDKITHVGGVLAQSLDNDMDGVPDNGVALSLARDGAVLLMTETEEEFERLSLSREFMERTGHHRFRNLYGNKVHPDSLS